MASKIKLSNANGKIVTIENNDSNMSDVTLNGASITKRVDTLANMRAMNELPETVWCSGYHSKNDGAFGSHFFRLKGVKTTEDDNGGTVIIISVGGSDYVYELQYSGTVNVKWFGAKLDGSIGDTAIIQTILGFAKNIYMPSGTYKPDATLSVFNSLVKVYGECKIDLTGKNFPAFTLGQKENGTVVASAIIGVTIDLPHFFGDRTLGSSAVFFRKCSTSYIKNSVMWELDYAIGGDGLVGSYEALACAFDKLDIRFCNFGVYDTTGFLQASSFKDCRIEGNLKSGVVLNSKNVDFYSCTIEGNNSSLISGLSEVNFHSLAQRIDFNSCYMESVSGVHTFFNESRTLNLNLNKGAYYREDALYLVGGNITLNTGSINLDGCLLSPTFAGVYNATFSGDSILIANGVRGFTNKFLVGTTFTAGATYSIYDRPYGYKTSSSILAGGNSTLQGNLTVGANTNRKLTSNYIGLGAGATETSWTDLYTLSGTFVAVPQVFDITIIGMVDSTNSRFCKYTLVVDQGLADIDATIAGSTHNMGGRVPAFQITGGVLQANWLSNFTTWVVHIDSKAFGYSL